MKRKYPSKKSTTPSLRLRVITIRAMLKRSLYRLIIKYQIFKITFMIRDLRQLSEEILCKKEMGSRTYSLISTISKIMKQSKVNLHLRIDRATEIRILPQAFSSSTQRIKKIWISIIKEIFYSQNFLRELQLKFL